MNCIQFRRNLPKIVVGFVGHEAKNVVLDAEKGGKGIMQNIIVNNKAEKIDDDTYKEYLRGVCI